MNALIVFTFAILGAFEFRVDALWCYETDPETGRLGAKDCPTCQFCAIASTGLGQSPTTMFGLGNEAEDLSVYAPIFEQGRDANWAYKVMSTCVLERYTIGYKEYYLRCFCNTDFCNKGEDVATYLSNTVNRDMLEESRLKK